MKHNPHLNTIFSNIRCYIIIKNSNKFVGMGVEEHGLLHFDKIDIVQEHDLMINNEQYKNLLWHQMYGLPNLCYLSFFTNRKMVNGLVNSLDK
jgi:hypothetical protein